MADKPSTSWSTFGEKVHQTRRTPAERAQAALDKVDAELAENERMLQAARDRAVVLRERAAVLKVERDYLAANPALRQADSAPESDPAAT